MKNLILERIEKELCPICAKNMSSVKIKIVKYMNREVFICDNHYVSK